MREFFSERFNTWRSSAGIEKLFVTGWCGSIATTLIALTVLFFAVGFWWPYWRSGDMDMWMVYEGFLLNDKLPQEYFDHPAYLTILLLTRWFGALHAVGLLPSHVLSTLPPVADNAASAVAWMKATQAARLLSLFLGLSFVTAFAYLVRALVRDWRVAALAAFALAFSGGFMMEMRIVRTELIAAGCAYTALLIVLITAQRITGAWRPILLGAAALLCTLAMLNKVHILFLVLAIPPIAIAFGRRVETPSCWQPGGRALAMVCALVIMAAVATALAWPIAVAGLFDAATVGERTRLFGTGFPVYQCLIGLWVFVCVIAYAVLFRVGALETVAALAAIVAGTAIGLWALALAPHVQNAVAVFNPLEKMLGFAVGIERDAGQGAIAGGSAIRTLTDGVGLLLARETFFLSSSPRPTIFLHWVLFVALLFAWRQGERKTVLQIALLFAVAFAVDLVGTVRGLKLEYFIITDPLIIIAAAWLLMKVPALKSHRWTFPVVLSLLVATVAVGLAEPIKHSFKRDMPLDFCGPHFHYTPRIERFSYCP